MEYTCKADFVVGFPDDVDKHKAQEILWHFFQSFENKTIPVNHLDTGRDMATITIEFMRVTADPLP